MVSTAWRAAGRYGTNRYWEAVLFQFAADSLILVLFSS